MFQLGSFVSIVSALQVAHDLLCIVAEERLYEDADVPQIRHEHVHAVLQRMKVLHKLLALRTGPDEELRRDVDQVLEIFGIDDFMILHEIDKIQKIDPSYYGLSRGWFTVCLQAAERTLTHRLEDGKPPTQQTYASALALRQIRTRAEDRLRRVQRMHRARIEMKTPVVGTKVLMDHFDSGRVTAAE